MKRRKARSSLYQVDFVAALFGAFLLLWVSKKSGLSRETENHVVVLDARCTGDDKARLLPDTSVQRCSSKSLVQLADSSLSLLDCESRSPDRDAFMTGALRGAPALDAMKLKSQILASQTSVAGAVAAKMTFSSNQPGSVISFGGMALAHTNFADSLVAVGTTSSVPPDFVDVSGLSEAVLLTRCTSCSDPQLYVHLGSSTGKDHPKFEIRLHSDGWTEPCLQASWIPPGQASSVSKVRFTKCAL